MMKSWGRGAAAVLIVVLAAACSFRDKKGPTAAPLDASAHMGYQDVNANIFTPKCLSCHQTKQPILTNYAGIMANLAKIQDMVLVQQKMPPRGPLSSDEQAYLKSWIEQGAPEEGAAPSPTPGESADFGTIQRPVKWEVVDKAVFEPKCFNCHYPHNPDGDTDYTDLPTLKDTMGSILFVTVTKPQMPPAPDSLSEGQKDILAAWVIDGMDMPSSTPAPVVKPSPVIMPSPTAFPLSSPVPVGSPGPLSSPLPPSASPSPALAPLQE